MGTGRRNLIFVWLAWFAVLNVLWLVLISAWVIEEELLGLVGSAVGASAAAAIHAQGIVGLKLRPRWLLGVLKLPGPTITESAFVLGALARKLTGRGKVRGAFRTVPVELPSDPGESATRRAMLIAGESFSPNGYVLGIDEERGLMLVHDLVLEDE